MIPSIRNPKYNQWINPKYNPHINPRYNAHINPKYNAQINPKYNSHINPQYNTHINPLYNPHINPKYNSRINPRYNMRINPKYNASINPLYSSLNGCPLIYTLDGTFQFHAVSLNDNENVGYIIYKENCVPSFYAFYDSEEGYILYDVAMTLIGYWTKTDVGFNWFDANSEWIFYVVL